MITTLYAGTLGLIYLVLSFFVIKGRFKHKVSLGYGNNVDMTKRIRLHGNFIEYVPLALILIFLAEQEGVSENIIHILGGGLVIGRIAHPLGLYRKEGTSLERAGGTLLTFLVIALASILCVKSYFIF